MIKKETIIEFMEHKSYKALKKKELRGVFMVPKKDKALFNELIEEMIDEGKVFINQNGKIGLPSKMGVIPCKLMMNQRGFGFASPLNDEYDDIFISSEDLNGAMNDDIVMVKTFRKLQGGRRAEGEIVKVVHHANTHVVGTIELSDNFGFVVPDNKKIPLDIFVPQQYLGDAKHLDKVVVKILRWPDKRRNPEGKVDEVLGKLGEPGVDVLSIIKEYRIDTEFPKEVLNEAKEIPLKIYKKDYGNRTDLTDLLTITIDGEDAKDLDDAVSYKSLEDGNVDIYVHIADVSHYVKEDSFLDREARKRGTSVYMVDRVVPMLPPTLSNGICSLNQKEDRLAFTCKMTLDRNGKVISYDFFESVINVNRRFSYKEVYEVIEETVPDHIRIYSEYINMLSALKEIAIILKKRRDKRGSINFDFDEAKVILDESGYPVDIVKRERNIAHQIIEELMILANETVASNFYYAKAPFIYRVHEKPKVHKLTDLGEYITKFGLTLRNINSIEPGDIKELLDRMKGKDEEQIVHRVVLRTMQKAVYDSVNIGHFGLGSKIYTHFTSPIRRYPDLYIHRIMKMYLSGQLVGHKLKYYERQVIQVSESSSAAEIKAEQAERDSLDLKKVEYMKKHINDTFSGVISSITSFGMFIELPNTIEGLVRLKDMVDDYYLYDEKNLTLIGERERKEYGIGQSVEIVVRNVDIETRQIDFMLKDIYDDLFSI